MYVCMYVCTHACMYVCMHAFMYVCVCMYVWICESNGCLTTPQLKKIDRLLGVTQMVTKKQICIYRILKSHKIIKYSVKSCTIKTVIMNDNL